MELESHASLADRLGYILRKRLNKIEVVSALFEPAIPIEHAMLIRFPSAINQSMLGFRSIAKRFEISSVVLTALISSTKAHLLFMAIMDSMSASSTSVLLFDV